MVQTTMRQFADVSISPWANPYSANGTNTGKNFYVTASLPQPLYRRVVLPPAPVDSDAAVADPVVQPGAGEEQDAPPGMP